MYSGHCTRTDMDDWTVADSNWSRSADRRPKRDQFGHGTVQPGAPNALTSDRLLASTAQPSSDRTKDPQEICARQVLARVRASQPCHKGMAAACPLATGPLEEDRHGSLCEWLAAFASGLAIGLGLGLAIGLGGHGDLRAQFGVEKLFDRFPLRLLLQTGVSS